MVLPREFSAVEQSKALSTLGCQVLCLCFSELCPGSPWKANNLWVLLRGQNLGRMRFDFAATMLLNICFGVLQTWVHLSCGVSPARPLTPAPCAAWSSSSPSLPLRGDAAEPSHGTNPFISHDFSLALTWRGV